MHWFKFLLALAVICVVSAHITTQPPPPPPPPVSPPPPCSCPCSKVPPVDCTPYSTCDPYKPQNIVWTVENCLCRPFQNACARNKANCAAVKAGQKPLLSVDKWHCQCSYTPKTCPRGGPAVCAWFPRVCKCSGKVWFEVKNFANFCELQRFSAMNSDPYDHYYVGR